MQRMLLRKDAAAYCGISVPSLEREILAGRLPMPVKLGGRDHWCVKALDKALDRLTQGETPDYLREFEARYGSQAA